MKRITILVPAYNEVKSLPLLYRRLSELIDTSGKEYEWEILVVDDGSSDNTADFLIMCLS